MWQLIRFEIEKILNKKVVWACLAGMVLMECMMVLNWIYPGSEGVQYFQGEEFVALKGGEAIREDQAVAERFAGPLTDEKVQAILTEYDMPDDLLKAHGLDPLQEGYYTHNSLYSALQSFYDGSGNWNGATVEEVYGNLASQLEIGYSSGWASFLYSVIYTLLSLGCVLTIILAPLFAEEYTKGMDALILTGAYGKTKCGWAKIFAGFAVSLALVAVTVLTMGGIYLATHGTAGWHASIQLNNLGMLEGVSYSMTCGQAVLLALLAWFTASLVLTAVSILLSARAKSAFNCLIAAFVLFTLPMFIPWYKMGFLNFPAQFLPIRQMQLIEMFEYPLLAIGGLEFSMIWLTIPVAVVVVLACASSARHTFAGHQVMG